MVVSRWELGLGGKEKAVVWRSPVVKGAERETNDCRVVFSRREESVNMIHKVAE